MYSLQPLAYQVCWAENALKKSCFFTHNPQLDSIWLQQENSQVSLYCLSPPLPLGLADYLCQKLNRLTQRKNWWSSLQCRWFKDPNYPREIQYWSSQIQAFYRELDPDMLPVHTAKPLGSSEEIQQWTLAGQSQGGRALARISGLETKEILTLLAGRVLFFAEIQELFTQSGYLPRVKAEKPLTWILDFLQLLTQQGFLQIRPAVGRDSSGAMVCHRCGQQQGIRRSGCRACQRLSCAYCEECLSLGLARECQPLYQIPALADPAPRFKPESGVPAPTVKVELKFALTPAQQQASQEVQAFVQKDLRRECLVWAVCGAGKTEVTFAAIAGALAQGKRILYAIPRREVVKELEPRLQQAFPQMRILALYGGSGNQRFAAADLYLATTHQTLRFFQNFDLVILDEMDAYPYRGSPLLHFALSRAAKPQGKKIYLTATPPPALQKSDLEEELCLVRISARHHGFPVPEPILLRDPALQLPKPNMPSRIPPGIIQRINQSIREEQVQVLVFVPWVRLVEPVAAGIRQALQEQRQEQQNFQGAERDSFRSWSADLREPAQWVEAVHAGDPRRDVKCRAFAQGRYPLLVSTTILERGITIPRVNVMVLFADKDQIFDAGTLIQMAGRAGRTTAYPQGQVWFVGNQFTGAMQKARAQIQDMNQEARRRGYLRPERG